ncbi:sensor histidine kinase [Massilia sp. YIM B02443]|uniref:sensor histidine kinase n=1 Tax=Massilia sp. YIM B02443 TaxID=3050127 RepID=UPI0025B66204|nr:histidine kinase [Massilia sp. YIM B02443]MDN4039648.1 histidine kinase [Massilia sp. YIM B02443]
MTETAHPHPDPELERLVAARTAELTEMLAWQANCWDDERRQLARQLHDSLGSSMTALTMHLALLSQHIPAENTSMRDRSAQMKNLLNGIIETNRKMQLDLWNDKLEFLGIKAALAELVPAFGAGHGLAANASLPEDDSPYTREVGALLLRCAEEGLRNAAAHAQAKRVDVILDDDGEMTMLTVRDDGVGPGADALASGPKRCHGLRLLRERARFLGGDLVLKAVDGGGAMLQMTLPREQIA